MPSFVMGGRTSEGSISPVNIPSLNPSQPVSAGSRKSLFKPSALCLAALAALLLTTTPQSHADTFLSLTELTDEAVESLGGTAGYLGEKDATDILSGYTISAIGQNPPGYYSFSYTLVGDVTFNVGASGRNMQAYPSLSYRGGEYTVLQLSAIVAAVYTATVNDDTLSNIAVNLTAEEGSNYTIKIVTDPDTKVYDSGKYVSTAPTNYAIAADGGTVTIENINVYMDGVVSGIWAGTYYPFNYYKGYDSAVRISNGDVYIRADVSDLQHHGLTTFSGGTIDISNASNVKILISGDASELDSAAYADKLTVYSAGMYQLEGGLISVTNVGQLSITVNTKEPGYDPAIPFTGDTQNYGIYALGQGSTGTVSGSSTFHYSNPAAWWTGIITLQGNSKLSDTGTSSLYVEVSNAYDGNIGLLANAHHTDATLTATDFDTITVKITPSEGGADYGVYAATNNRLNYGSVYLSDYFNNGRILDDPNDLTLVSTINLQANKDIAITAATGIGSLVKQFESSITLNAGNSIKINSSKSAIVNYSMYTGTVNTALSAPEITLQSDNYGVYSAILYESPNYQEEGFIFLALDKDSILEYTDKYYVYDPGKEIYYADSSYTPTYIGITAPGVTFDENKEEAFVSVTNIVASSKLTITSDKFVAAAYVDDGAVKYADTTDGYKSGRNQINLNSADGAGTTVLKGAVWSANESEINIGLNDDKSSWTGFAQDNRGVADDGSSKYAKAGAINVTAKSGATWYVRPVDLNLDASDAATASKSYLTSWNSSEGLSYIDLRLDDYTGTVYTDPYQAVNIGTLSGSGTTFKVNTNVDGDRGEGKSTDQAIIHSGSGAHSIYVAISGSGQTKSQADYLILHLEENGATSTERDVTDNGDGSFTINTKQNGDNDLSFALVDSSGSTTSTVVAQGLYYYSLATREAQSDVKEEYGLEDGKGTEWYLVRTSENVAEDPDPDPTPIPDPQPDPDPGPSKDPETNEGKTVAALSGIGNKLNMHYAQLDDLRKRLGEVRYGAQDGLWVRYIYQRNKYDGVSSNVSARQNLHAINLGLDRIVSQDEDSMWLLGGNFKYGHDNEKIKSARGKGNLNSYGLNLYATYANQYGCYTDLVVSFDDYHQKLGSKLEDNSSAGGSFNTWGWGASIEIGKMFSTTQNNENRGPWHNHWWVEPQAQLSYYWIKGKDFSMNNGMTVKQNNGDSLVGRLGVVVGKQWSYGGADKVDKRYVQAYLKGGVKHEFLGNQKTKINGVTFDHKLRGTAGYYGAGIDWNLTKQVRAYAQVERDAGGRYKKDIEASVGLKWQF